MKRLTNAEKAEIHKELEEAEKAKFKPYENKIADLEKENAELQNKVRFMGKQIDNLKAIAKGEQLTKAKELLKQWLQTSKASGCDNINIVADTEQFLKGE